MLQELFSKQLDKFDDLTVNDKTPEYPDWGDFRTFIVDCYREIYNEMYKEIKNIRDKHTNDDKIDEILSNFLEKL